MQRNVSKNRTERKAPDMKPAPDSLLAAKQIALKAWPIFGGTTPTDPPKTDPPKADPPKTDPPAGGTPPATPDPLAELAKDPVKLQQLLSQVATTSQSLATMQEELNGYKTKEVEAENAKKTNEERLQTTIEQKDALLAKAQLLLGDKTLENALLNLKDYTWHDAQDALRNLRENPEIKITVDIEKQIGSVEGLEKAAKALATTKPWMLSAGPGVTPPANGAVTPPPPASGAPPAPPTTDAAKAARRAELIGKHPVIAAGR